MRMYAFTYIVGDMKNTGLVKASSLARAVVSVVLGWPAIDIIGISLVPQSMEIEATDLVSGNIAICMDELKTAVFEWGNEGD